jgi:hypothetical protein
LEELYEEFWKFSRAEVLHFRKLGQQRKFASENECSRPYKYNKRKEGHSSFDTSHRQVHSIDLDGCGPPKNWEKNFRPPWPESENMSYDPRKDRIQTRGGHSSRGEGRGQFQDIPLYCMFHERDTVYRTRDCPIFLVFKKMMTQKHNQSSTTVTVKEVNHTFHWQEPSQSSSSNQPSYQHFNLCPEYQSNYHRHTSHTITHRRQAKSTHPSRQSLTLPHLCK